MTTPPSTTPGSQPRSPRSLVHGFPTPKAVVGLAYTDLTKAAYGTDEEKKKLGDPAALPRPWDPASCSDPDLRHAVWLWLEDVVAWLNHEYTWDITGLIPTCWPNHPHLVHEVAVVADQRRRAGAELTSDALEEWHRYCLPAFVDRMGGRLKTTCEDGHAGWPARSRHNQHTSARDTERREDAYAVDIDALPRRTPTHTWPLEPPEDEPAEEPPVEGDPPEQEPPREAPRRRFKVVDRDTAVNPRTGEIRDAGDRDHGGDPRGD